ncbi:MAG: outer membrane protein [Planctomycetota bacterium]
MRSAVITTSMLVATGLVAAPILPGALAGEAGLARRARVATWDAALPLAPLAPLVPVAPVAAANSSSPDSVDDTRDDGIAHGFGGAFGDRTGDRLGAAIDNDGADHFADDDDMVDRRRVYLSGMLGVGTADSVAPPAVAEQPSALVAGTLFGGDGAVGITAPRPWGAARVECEARGRTTALPGPDGRWSLMANLWHDISLSDRLALYGGGGAGTGGTRGADGAAKAPAGLAWQVGGGLAYDLAERITLDVGYRYGGIESRARGSAPAVGEAVIAVRIHDPFRGWWQRREAARGEAAAVRRGGG